MTGNTFITPITSVECMIIVHDAVFLRVTWIHDIHFSLNQHAIYHFIIINVSTQFIINIIIIFVLGNFLFTLYVVLASASKYFNIQLGKEE